MPIYTCTTVDSALTTEVKAALAAEITHIHSAINHVPSTYVNVVFNEQPAENVYTDGVPASPLLITGWVRDGHPEAETTRLATEIADAATRITGIAAEPGVGGFRKQPCPLRRRRRPRTARARRRSRLACRRNR